MTLRSKLVQKNYEETQATHQRGWCPFCHLEEDNEIILESNTWRVIENKWPWDLVTKVQLVVVLRRHAPQLAIGGITLEEQRDLIKIREKYKDYAIFHNGATNRSIDHLHLQLIIWK